MERTTQKQDDQLLQYLDGTRTGKYKTELEGLLAKNSYLEIRLEELRKVHVVLGSKARLEQPSKLFIDKVMQNLDRLPVRRRHVRIDEDRHRRHDTGQLRGDELRQVLAHPVAEEIGMRTEQREGFCDVKRRVESRAVDAPGPLPGCRRTRSGRVGDVV